MEEINIQQAKLDDAIFIYNNIKKCADDMEKQGLRHWKPYYAIEKIEEDIKENRTYIVKTNKQVIGNFILILNEDKKEIYISKLAIIPEYAGKGIGSKCLNFIEQYARINDFNVIELDVYEKSISAIRFYEKNGYEIIGEKPTRRFMVKKMKKELKRL